VTILCRCDSSFLSHCLPSIGMPDTPAFLCRACSSLMCPSLPLTSLLRLSAAHGAQIRSTMMISDTNRSTEPHQQTHNLTVLPAYIIRITDATSMAIPPSHSVTLSNSFAAREQRHPQMIAGDQHPTYGKRTEEKPTSPPEAIHDGDSTR
jgi:hypothetical protein